MSSIIGIFGDRGAGKSLFMTMLLWDSFVKGLPIVTNYKLYFPEAGDRIRYKSFAAMCEFPDDLDSAVIGCDEFQAGADSRGAMSTQNRKLTKLCTQIRKRQCSMFYTTQRFNLIDRRVREQTDGFIAVKNTSEEDWYEAIFMVDEEIIVNRLEFYGRPAYGLYNTNEIID